MQTECHKMYKQAIKDYSNLDDKGKEESGWRKFKEKIFKQQKIEITFDASIVDVIMELIKETERENSIQALTNYIVEMKRFGLMLHQNKFIYRRHKEQLDSFIKEYMDRDQLKLQSISKYLKSSKTPEEFWDDWTHHNLGDFTTFWKEHLKQNNEKLTPILATIYEAMQRFNLNKQIDEEVKDEIERLLQECNGSDQEIQKLNMELEMVALERQLQNHPEIISDLDKEFGYICEILQRFSSLSVFSNIKMRVGRFGSLVNGFATDDADLDITILTQCYVNEIFMLETLSGFLKLELDEKKYKIEYISNAQTPLIKIIRLQQSNCQKLEFDILINNICGIINSKFLKKYSEMHKSIRYMGILVKLWAKKAKIIAKTCLSSYSLILMMLYFLIHEGIIENILIPVSQTDNEPIMIKRKRNQVIEEFAIQNEFLVEGAKKKIKRFNIYENFIKFLKFYQEGGTYEKERDQQQKVISLDGSSKAVEEDKLFTIKDPFDEPHNPGRASKNNLFVMSEIQNSISVFQSRNKGKILDLFQQKG